MKNLNIEELNETLKHKTPDQIIEWALTLSDNRIVTTSFGIYSAVLLSTFARKDKDINVVWCDTLFNNEETYQHADDLINRFQLNIQKYQPLIEKDEVVAKVGIPELDTPEHEEFTEIVKIEPFKRAIKEQDPEIWFTNIRVRQTEYRNSKNILSYSKDGILKVSPFYYWSDFDLDNFLEIHQLPKNKTYFDPTKALQNRECGIHLQ